MQLAEQDQRFPADATLQVRGWMLESLIEPFICARVDSRVSPASLTWLQVGMLRKDAGTTEKATYQVWKFLLYRPALSYLKENLHFNNLMFFKTQFYSVVIGFINMGNRRLHRQSKCEIKTFLLIKKI